MCRRYACKAHSEEQQVWKEYSGPWCVGCGPLIDASGYYPSNIGTVCLACHRPLGARPGPNSKKCTTVGKFVVGMSLFLVLVIAIAVAVG